MEHLHREQEAEPNKVSLGVQTRGGRLRSKDLFTESERILAKTGSGMSLLERVARDERLRNELINILTGLGDQAEEVEALIPMRTSGVSGVAKKSRKIGPP